MARMLDDTDKRLPVIEITFEDISKSKWIDTLNKELEGFLQGQKFCVTNGDKNTILILLL